MSANPAFGAAKAGEFLVITKFASRVLMLEGISEAAKLRIENIRDAMLDGVDHALEPGTEAEVKEIHKKARKRSI